MKKLTLVLFIFTISANLFGSKDLTTTYEYTCWKKYDFQPTLIEHFCPTDKEFKRVLKKRSNR